MPVQQSYVGNEGLIRASNMLMSILNDNIARIGTSFQNYLINFFPFSFWQRGHSMPGPLANIPVQLQVGLDVPFFLHIFFMWLWSYIQVPKQNVF